ncbi:DUF6483 family protein [Paenibacillus pini]|uniref:No significant homology n=1 Tax=Paenibacillus pini JCM 16418 TaxID=1236976 RepID=W7YTJ8_9BACL|nr:DUF6483 family protein [Paenibacillus pini]GAF10513.1 no significant homology [Paenibacillus pini JCM 16418]
MFRKDYLMQMVEDMMEVVGKVFGLKQERKFTEALWEIDDLLSRSFRLNSRLLNSLSVEDIIDMFRLSGGVETDKLQTVARLLQEEAAVYKEMQQEEESVKRLMKSLHLYLFAHMNGADQELLKLTDRIYEIREQVRGYRVPVKTERLILSYEEQRGQYGEAENSLYRLLDQAELTEEEGFGLYNRLLQFDDDALIAGGLPRNEVEEGLQELRRKFSM